MALKAIILGASGLIGSNLLEMLLSDDRYDEVIVFVRKKLILTNSKLIQIITDFNPLEELKNVAKVDVVFCCLGSTKKKTPDLEKYKKVDHDIPLFFANEALNNGASQYHIVSSLSANPNSSNFYSRMKGEIEKDLKTLNYPSLFIYQPSFLVGDREENRPLEKIIAPIMKIFNFLLIGSLKKYQSIAAEDVAKAMANESIKNKRGIFVIESDKIKELA